MMAAVTPDIKLLGLTHLLILISIPVLAGVLSYWCRRSKRAGRSIRFGLGAFLIVNELVWYAYVLRTEGLHFPQGLPLELCNVTLWIAVVAAWTLKPWAVEIVYYAGLAGSSMALLTPDLWAALWSYPTAYFFLAHGMAVVTELTLVWGKLATPRPGSWWKILVLVNAYAAALGIFDAIFKTNYMYLREKPVSASLLDYFGPWPYYLIGSEVLALALFWLLGLPFRRKAGVSRR
ncbi:MAG TPA: TIGR02206 family membrane protein [Bryobacteraceae bacterium]|nr:TIGR02206 family membrane protein [Bryobacteraceae bacterium]